MRYFTIMMFSLALLLALLGAGVAGASHASAAETPFDAPASTLKASAKVDPGNPQGKHEVKCFVYPRFMVKQVDLGEVGADSLSITPVVEGKTPACKQEKEPDEYVIPSEIWSGYFKGVKGDYLFLDAADGINGGLGFMVFSMSGKNKVFDDVAVKGLKSIAIKDGALTLRYRRGVAAPCSAVAEGAACAERIVKEMGVEASALASCETGYKTAKLEMAKGRCEAESSKDAACIDKQLKLLDEQKWDSSPSVLAYDAEVVLGAGAPAIKALGAPASCRPAD
jgi:hypothetical protein